MIRKKKKITGAYFSKFDFVEFFICNPKSQTQVAKYILNIDGRLVKRLNSGEKSDFPKALSIEKIDMVSISSSHLHKTNIFYFQITTYPNGCCYAF
jgi:hypothetical protein